MTKKTKLKLSAHGRRALSSLTKEQREEWRVWASSSSDSVFERAETRASDAGAKAARANIEALGPAYAAQRVAMGALAALLNDGELLAAKEAFAELGEWMKCRVKDHESKKRRSRKSRAA
jgi:hypothetical protein